MVLLFIFNFTQVKIEEEAGLIELAIQNQYKAFDEAFELVERDFPSFNTIQNTDFLVFDHKGKLVSWTNNGIVPAVEEFLISPSDYLLTNRHGEFLYKGYDMVKPDGLYKVFAFTTIRRVFNTDFRPIADDYNENIISNSVIISYEEDSYPVTFNDNVIFYIKKNPTSSYSLKLEMPIYIGLLLFVIGLLISTYYFSILIKEKHGFIAACVFNLLVLGVLRVVMIGVYFPLSFFELSVFSEATFRFEWFFSSLGDAFFNVLVLNFILVFVITQKDEFVHQIKLKQLQVTQFILIILSYFSFYLFADTIQILFAHSQISLDISESITFPIERIVAYFLVASLAIFYFLINYLSIDSFKKDNYSIKQFVLFHVVALVLSGLVMKGFSNPLLLLGGNFTFSSFLFYYKLPSNLKKLRFNSLNYLIFSAIFLAFVGSILIHKSVVKKEFNSMQKFATFLQFDRDLEGEYLLSNIIRQIKGDLIINGKMLNPQSQYESIVKRVKRNYLNTYFNNYEIEITLFDELGEPLSGDNGDHLNAVESRYQGERFSTGYTGVYYDNRMNIRKRKKFVCFVTLERYQNVTGYLQIELHLKKFTRKRVLPQLFLDRNGPNESDYDYAVFDRNQLIYKSGDFEYESKFSADWLGENKLYNEGIGHEKFYHLGVKSGGNIFIISRLEYPLAHLISNFSFLFVIFLVFGSLIVLVNYLIHLRQMVQLNFSTKILLYSGASFVIPLIIVGAAVMSSTNASNRKEIDKSNLKKTRIMTDNLDDHLIAFNDNKLNKEDLENTVSELALHSGMDLNVYNKDGRLLASSTPAIFESNIFSKFLIPQAMSQLIARGKESIVSEELIGSFQYKTSYVSILSPDTGAFLGVLGSPYFASKNHVKRQQLEVFGNIINIFTFVFILSIFIAYIIITKITKPIVAIADRLHDTGFVEVNQPIEWSTDDEIGTLVSEYNNMLEKLESTKIELARNEKEAAWREMAKQVAHEIKNPLTPMKLTIQHLQRILKDKLDDHKSLDILLSQIDTLDEIVTSFSHFAKMPTPESEPFDIRIVLEKSIDLHVDKVINKDLEMGTFSILGDKKLFGRIFNNLILNAFQAMKINEQPSLNVLCIAKEGWLQIEFEDHGEGIPENIQDKVFLPNFSTKETGSGIGLAVAKRGVEHAGGEIWFETQKNQGTTFYIKLPLLDSNE